MYWGFIIHKNGGTKSSYAKWGQTLSYCIENVYTNSLQVPKPKVKLLFFHSKVKNCRLKHKNLLEVKSPYLKLKNKKLQELAVTNFISKLFFFNFRVTNSKLKNKTLHFELLAQKLNIFFTF